MSSRMSGVALRQVRHVRPVRPDAAEGLVARVYAQLERDFGMVAPPVALHSAAPDLLAASWSTLRESLLATGRAPRATKEAVAAAVSRANACPYCVDVHGTVLSGLVPGRVAAAVAADRPERVGDPQLRAAAAWAGTAWTDGTAPPVPPAQVPEILGTAVVFHYLNRMVNVFLPASPMPTVLPAPVRSALRRPLGLLAGRGARRSFPPGRSLDLLPAAPLPDELAWAGGNPAVAGALGRAAAVVAAAGERSVPDPVRALVRQRLAGWDGRPTGPSRGWVTDAAGDLPAALRPAGVLALLVALASYQVDDGVIDDVRAGGGGDAALLELTGWAAFAASVEMGRRAGGIATAAATQAQRNS